ncbi:MAG TPA: hypothetical protein V6D13_14535 [Halomicronema sp.]
MYYSKFNDKNPNLQKLFPQGVPVYNSTPDEFQELYDETGELLDIIPAFRVNFKAMTKDDELKLLNLCATAMDDPHFIQGIFRLLDNGWLTIPEDWIESVVWRAGEKVFCFKCDGNPTLIEQPILHSFV